MTFKPQIHEHPCYPHLMIIVSKYHENRSRYIQEEALIFLIMDGYTADFGHSGPRLAIASCGHSGNCTLRHWIRSHDRAQYSRCTFWPVWQLPVWGQSGQNLLCTLGPKGHNSEWFLFQKVLSLRVIIPKIFFYPERIIIPKIFIPKVHFILKFGIITLRDKNLRNNDLFDGNLPNNDPSE